MEFLSRVFRINETVRTIVNKEPTDVKVTTFRSFSSFENFVVLWISLSKFNLSKITSVYLEYIEIFMLE